MCVYGRIYLCNEFFGSKELFSGIFIDGWIGRALLEVCCTQIVTHLQRSWTPTCLVIFHVLKKWQNPKLSLSQQTTGTSIRQHFNEKWINDLCQKQQKATLTKQKIDLPGRFQVAFRIIGKVKASGLTNKGQGRQAVQTRTTLVAWDTIAAAASILDPQLLWDLATSARNPESRTCIRPC